MKAILLITLAMTAAAGAVTITQSHDYPVSLSANTVSDLPEITPASGTYLVAPGSYFTFAAAPFDTSLGNLTSVTVIWSMTGSFSATAGPVGGGGSVSFGGDIAANGTVVGGGGGGGGSGGGPSTAFSSIFPTGPSSYSANLTSGAPGFDAFTGTSPATVTWDSPVVYSGNADSTNLSVTGTGNVTVVYNYDVVPEPASCVLGLVSSLALVLRRRRDTVRA
jgi:hypothetical protein